MKDSNNELIAQIRRNVDIVMINVQQAASRAGRSPEDVKLLVVTKAHPIDIARAVVEAGIQNLGENYVEEARPKIAALTEHYSVMWHMIGHVQSRKAHSVVGLFDYMHSLDSVKLAQRLSNHAVLQGRVLSIMLEVNVSGEGTKSGWRIDGDNWDETLEDIGLIAELPNLKPTGLMTIPPYATDPSASRPYYKRLKQFQEYLQENLNGINWEELSMGMSGDYEVAIEEGATWVRIGQAILGPRFS